MPFIYLCYQGFITDAKISENISDWSIFGQYGAFVDGVIGTFFSFIAALLVYITYRHQVNSFKEQSDKLEESKDRDYQRDFNNRFFNLINLLEHTINGISIEKKFDSQAGRHSVFKYFYLQYEKKYNTFREVSLYNDDYKTDAKKAWASFYNETNFFIIPYIKTLIFLLKEIENYKGEKRYYSQLIVCQLNDYEKWIIFLYYSFTETKDGDNVIGKNEEICKFIDLFNEDCKYIKPD